MATTTSSIRALGTFPSPETIQKIFNVAGLTTEGAWYAHGRITKSADNATCFVKEPGLKKDVLDATARFAEHIELKLTPNGNPHRGQYIETSDQKNLQKNIAEAAAKDLADKLSEEIKLDYAVSEAGHYVRGYSSSNGALDSHFVDSLDKLFNAWLISKDYIIKDGFIYNANDKVQSENTRIDPEIIKQLLEDGGLEEFMLNKGVKAKLRVRDYPGERTEAEKKQEVTSTLKRVEAARVAEEQAQVPEVEAEEAPHAGAGSAH
ncbi:MAG: hypothetical protein QM652_10995 [Legionella sp.]|uniref:hypothetical protein n=1 Tax=Legionella sp. TaxID=459 RepID=UPI0039E28AB8